MFVISKLQSPEPIIFRNPSFHHRFIYRNNSSRRRYTLRQPSLRLALLTLRSAKDSSEYSSPSQLSQFDLTAQESSSRLTSSIGQPPIQLSQWTLTHKHFVLLNVVACVTAISASWLFFAAIPTLLAFKKAAESLEKLLDVTREELPDTMAAIRLSGMEISDLTMELSDLGQGISQGVKSSTRAVRVAEDRLRKLTNMSPGSVASNQDRGKPTSNG